MCGVRRRRGMRVCGAIRCRMATVRHHGIAFLPTLPRPRECETAAGVHATSGQVVEVRPNERI
eukprot:scaffold5_cov112-Isochrysis_galbana.AAC.1